ATAPAPAPSSTLSLHDALPIFVRRLRGAIRFVLLAGQEGSLGGSRTTLRLHPAPVHPTQRASPQAHQVQPQNRVGHFQRDATNVDRKSTRLNSSHGSISYAVFC